MINRYDECGGGYLSTPNGTITSPSYPSNYPNNAECIYIVSQPTGTVILLTFLSMDIKCDCEWVNAWPLSYTICDYDDNLEIRDGPSDDSPFLRRYCGSAIPASVQSSQNQLWMR